MASNSRNNVVGMITYPNRNVPNMEPVDDQPRQPRNLQGLLKFAMEATKGEDAPSSSDFNAMEEERRRFLEEALKSWTVDVAEAMHKSIKMLSSPDVMHSLNAGEPLPEEIQTAFDTLLDYIDDIDIANDFHKMGGFAIFPVCYGSDNEMVRAQTSFVLAELCQNNPYCQEKALECGLLNVLLNLATTERNEALIKCLYAISCCTREYEPAGADLIAQGGCNTLAQMLHAPELSARTKAAYLIRYLSDNFPQAREQFIKNNLVAIVIEHLKFGRDDTTVHMLGVIMSLVEEGDPRVLAQCRDPKLDLKKTLQSHIALISNEEFRYKEEKEYCTRLLTKVFDGWDGGDALEVEAADR